MRELFTQGHTARNWWRQGLDQVCSGLEQRCSVGGHVSYLKFSGDRVKKQKEMGEMIF